MHSDVILRSPAIRREIRREERAMRRCLAASLGLSLLFAGCVTQQPWTPTVDTYGSERAQFLHRDMNECRLLA
jgi:hypothetical protein